MTFFTIFSKKLGFVLLFQLYIIQTIYIWYQMIALTIRNKMTLVGIHSLIRSKVIIILLDKTNIISPAHALN